MARQASSLSRRLVLRTCVGCRKRVAVTELLRVVAAQAASGPGEVTLAVPDPARRLPGRGASLHPDPACYALAEKRRAFGRALRVSGVLDTALVREYVAGLGSNTGGAGAGPHSEKKWVDSV